MLVAKGIVEVVPNQPYYILVANQSNLLITVPKYAMVAGRTKCFPSLANARDHCVRQYLPVTSISVHMARVDKGTLLREHRAITTKDAKKTKRIGGSE